LDLKRPSRATALTLTLTLTLTLIGPQKAFTSYSPNPDPNPNWTSKGLHELQLGKAVAGFAYLERGRMEVRNTNHISDIEGTAADSFCHFKTNRCVGAGGGGGRVCPPVWRGTPCGEGGLPLPPPPAPLDGTSGLTPSLSLFQRVVDPLRPEYTWPGLSADVGSAAFCHTPDRVATPPLVVTPKLETRPASPKREDEQLEESLRQASCSHRGMTTEPIHSMRARVVWGVIACSSGRSAQVKDVFHKRGAYAGRALARVVRNFDDGKLRYFFSSNYDVFTMYLLSNYFKKRVDPRPKTHHVYYVICR